MKALSNYDKIKYIDPSILKLIQEIIEFDLDDLENNLKPPVISGVYILKAKGKIVYIGRSKDIYNRVRTHQSTKEFDCYSYKEMNIELAKIWERILINKHIPELNKDLLTKKIEIC